MLRLCNISKPTLFVGLLIGFFPDKNLAWQGDPLIPTKYGSTAQYLPNLLPPG
jgi:hypothetical protein